MSKSREELIASVRAQFGKITNGGKTAQGRWSADEANDVFELLILLEGLSMPNIDIADIDDLNVATSVFADTPAAYVVTAERGEKRLKVGMMTVLSDNSAHVVTEVFITHYVLNANGNIDTSSHIDSRVFQYFRSCKISGGTLPTEPFVWTSWQQLSNDGEYYPV